MFANIEKRLLANTVPLRDTGLVEHCAGCKHQEFSHCEIYRVPALQWRNHDGCRSHTGKWPRDDAEVA